MKFYIFQFFKKTMSDSNKKQCTHSNKTYDIIPHEGSFKPLPKGALVGKLSSGIEKPVSVGNVGGMPDPLPKKKEESSVVKPAFINLPPPAIDSRKLKEKETPAFVEFNLERAAENEKTLVKAKSTSPLSSFDSTASKEAEAPKLAPVQGNVFDSAVVQVSKVKKSLQKPSASEKASQKPITPSVDSKKTNVSSASESSSTVSKKTSSSPASESSSTVAKKTNVSPSQSSKSLSKKRLPTPILVESDTDDEETPVEVQTVFDDSENSETGDDDDPRYGVTASSSLQNCATPYGDFENETPFPRKHSNKCAYMPRRYVTHSNSDKEQDVIGMTPRQLYCLSFLRKCFSSLSKTFSAKSIVNTFSKEALLDLKQKGFTVDENMPYIIRSIPCSCASCSSPNNANKCSIIVISYALAHSFIAEAEKDDSECKTGWVCKTPPLFLIPTTYLHPVDKFENESLKYSLFTVYIYAKSESPIGIGKFSSSIALLDALSEYVLRYTKPFHSYFVDNFGNFGNWVDQNPHIKLKSV